MKSPFNWVGNKYKFLPQINEIVKGRNYNMIVDLFMGSGNILLNLECETKKIIGNDKQRLIPNVFSALSLITDDFSPEEIDELLNKNQRFSSKESYYSFRDYWDTKYLANQFDRKFCLETALLLKMCSNSMVRFNKDGLFNQGFRGLGSDSEFFKQSMLDDIIFQINVLIHHLKLTQHAFTVKDFKEYKDGCTTNRLLILDPPYALGDTGMYSKDFDKSNCDFLLNLAFETKNDFILFNYIEHGDLIYKELQDLINKKDLRVIEIGDNNVSAGQGGKIQKHVKEVMVTNVQM